LHTIESNPTRRIADQIVFARTLLHHPLRVGAVAPSSPALAKIITAGITPDRAPVIELGPGTGVFTRALLARGISEESLALVESDVRFVHLLEREFPRANVVFLDASRIRTIELFRGQPAGAVVSGLPLLSMSMRKVLAIYSAVLYHMRQDAAIYQFTYGPRCPVPYAVLERLGLRCRRTGSTLANLPPATVYRLWPRVRRQRFVAD
jgi:phospholipid N-methyltransferase